MSKRIILTVVVLVIIIIHCGDDTGSSWNSDFNALFHYKLDALSPCGLTSDGTFFYVVDRIFPGKIYKISQTDGSTVAEYDTPGNRPTGITWDGNNFWTCDEDSNRIYKQDTDFNLLEEHDAEGENISGILYGSNGKLYTSDYVLGKIYEYDVDTMTVEAEYSGEMNYDRFFGLAEDDGEIWVCEYYLGYAVLFNSDFTVNKYYVAPWEHPTGMYISGNDVWFVDVSLRSLIKAEMPTEG